jgi:hypothetical protein
MGYLIRTTKRRIGSLLGAFALLIGGFVLFTGGAADAATAAACVPGEAAGVPCQITGTLTVTSGTMTLTAPPALAWAATVNGLDQELLDSNAADQAYTVDDATGTAPGWHVNLAATTFTNGTATLPDTGTLATNGSAAAATDATAPSAACTAASTCTLPTDNTTYPVAVTTGAAVAPVNIYDASAATGQGSIVIGTPGANPVGWWLAVPANATVGAYTSTVTVSLVAGP